MYVFQIADFSATDPSTAGPSTAGQEEDERNIAALVNMYFDKPVPFIREVVNNNLTLEDSIDEILGQDPPVLLPGSG